MKICSLASGSKGNSIFIESASTRILVDAGLSALQIKNRLKSIEIAPESLDAIIITHAHRDHVAGIDVLSHQFDIPVYGHNDTLKNLAYILRRTKNIIPWKKQFHIKDLTLKPFPVSHDAIPTVGYLITDSRFSMAICTDLGIITREVEEHLTQARVVVLESNHDPDMLINGPYPWELKERIASQVGHLSNHDSGNFLKSILNGQIQKILLAHLSEENNYPELAKNTVLDYIGYQHVDLVNVLGQRKVSPIFSF
jgi:phosphoribosyl 1,2-cyclic phosphodiesterase